MAAEIISGRVESVNKWKSGKGYFVQLEGQDKECYYFGGQKGHEGEKVAYEVKPGSGQFSDKWEVNRKLSDAEAQAIPGTEPTYAKQETPEQPKPGDSVYMSRNESIARQCCLKAAARVVAELKTREKVPDWGAITHSVMDMADKFYHAYILGEEEPEPEEGP